MKRIVVALAVLVSLGALAGVAQGVVVQEFSFQVKDIRTWGGFTVVFSSRSYDPSGGIPAELDQNYLRLPKGATVPRVFRKKRYYCQAKKLVDKVRLEKGSGRFTPYFEKLLKGRKKQPRRSKNLVQVCRFARIGTGRVLVDARPFEERPIPADLHMFWTKPARGAVAAFAIVGIPDDTFPVVKENPTVRETVPTINANFYSEPTANGLYDYKLVLPTGPINGIRISVAEVNVTTTGITHRKKVCSKKRRGKCIRRKTKRTFWFREPPCPPSGQLSFEAFYGYKTEPDQLKTVSIPCPDFR
ncbi:MAG: hypothetical protein ACRDLQ_11775 [Solirubrobacterales bacterium]